MAERQGRRPKYARDIGPEVLARRRAGVCWKRIEDEFGMTRAWLARKAKAAEARERSERERAAAVRRAKVYSIHHGAGRGASLLG